jgi:hypothetical protein
MCIILGSICIKDHDLIMQGINKCDVHWRDFNITRNIYSTKICPRKIKNCHSGTNEEV